MRKAPPVTSGYKVNEQTNVMSPFFPYIMLPPFSDIALKNIISLSSQIYL